MTDKQNSAVPCIVCREDIRLGARKCIHCDSFQDWRHHLNFSNTVLALLVALVSVSTVLVPILDDLLEADVSETAVSYHGVHENLFNLVATNTGNREGIITEETLTLHNDASETIVFKLEPIFAQIIVPSGATRQSTTRLNPLDFSRFLSWLDSNIFEKATLYVRVDNLGAEGWDGTFPVESNDIKTIQAYAKRFPIPPSP